MRVEDLKKLKQIIPFKWRVQSSFKNSKGVICKMIAYVDSRDVQDKLDEVCGIEGWQSKFESVKGTLFCLIGIKIEDEWLWKSDAGSESKTEAKKGEASDAFKRAAVHWGINRDAYKVEILTINGKEYNGKNYPCDEAGKFLKGQALHDYCNKKANIVEMENYDIITSNNNEESLV